MTRRRTGPSTGRRHFLAGLAGGAAAGLAGCANPFTGPATETGEVTLADFRGSGPLVESRGDYGGTRIEDLPDLSGALTIYLGGGEGGIYGDLLDLFRRIYPDFEPRVNDAPSAQLANTLLEEAEGGSTTPDVFWSIDAGSLAIVADSDLFVPMPDDVVSAVPSTYHPGDEWVGVAGRARSVPYNADALSAGDVPESVMNFPGTAAFADAIGWAPSYGAFQSFVTAMRVVEGEDATRQWLEDMQTLGASTYSNEFFVSNAVADGELAAGFANHYYALRVRSARSDAPLDLAFTSGDAGALINVAGAAVIRGTDRQELAENFVHHLLTVEAQEFFATRTFAYPMISGVPPVGGLPSIDELNPPSIDLQELSNVEPTLQLMRDVGVL